MKVRYYEGTSDSPDMEGHFEASWLSLSDDELLERFGLRFLVNHALRNMLVETRACAKRYRKGTKTVAGMTEAEVATKMGAYKWAELDRPDPGTRGASAEDKVAKAFEGLSPAQQRAMLEKLGIIVHDRQ